MTHRIGFISDLHILSRYGLVPPGWRQKRDPLAPLQTYLWSRSEERRVGKECRL